MPKTHIVNNQLSTGSLQHQNRLPYQKDFLFESIFIRTNVSLVITTNTKTQYLNIKGN